MSEKFEPKFSEDGFLCCPQCGCTWMHVEKTLISMEDIERLCIMKDTTGKQHLELCHEPSKHSGGLDYRIHLLYNCEEGCSGLISIIHHEGAITIEHQKEVSKNDQ